MKLDEIKARLAAHIILTGGIANTYQRDIKDLIDEVERLQFIEKVFLELLQ